MCKLGSPGADLKLRGAGRQAEGVRAPSRAPAALRTVAGMDLVEITQKERLSREAAAARLHALADSLARHNDVEFERNGVRVKMHVPDEVELEIELEVSNDGTELEIELTW
jgi:amphi-Trp domain-containing protein